MTKDFVILKVGDFIQCVIITAYADRNKSELVHSPLQCYNSNGKGRIIRTNSEETKFVFLSVLPYYYILASLEA